MIATSNMYRQSIKSWNPFVGCEYDCMYCVSSFKRQMKRRKKHCFDCYNFKPHFHAKRLNNALPRTNGKDFIFACDMGDVAFCEPRWMEQILARIEQLPNRTFLLQSKNPSAFRKYWFPENVLIGTTIETDRDRLYRGISSAPLPSQRYRAIMKLRHRRKIVTIEPVLDFDIDVIEKWIREIRPEACYVGYDSKNNYLPEPELSKVKILIRRLKDTTDVRPKTIRTAWWEKQSYAHIASAKLFRENGLATIPLRARKQ